MASLWIAQDGMQTSVYRAEKFLPQPWSLAFIPVVSPRYVVFDFRGEDQSSGHGGRGPGAAQPPTQDPRRDCFGDSPSGARVPAFASHEPAQPPGWQRGRPTDPRRVAVSPQG